MEMGTSKDVPGRAAPRANVTDTSSHKPPLGGKLDTQFGRPRQRRVTLGLPGALVLRRSPARGYAARLGLKARRNVAQNAADLCADARQGGESKKRNEGRDQRVLYEVLA